MVFRLVSDEGESLSIYTVIDCNRNIHNSIWLGDWGGALLRFLSQSTPSLSFLFPTLSSSNSEMS